MLHTAPVFRGLLLALAESDPPDLSVLPALADWLSEQGDEQRAAKVRVEILAWQGADCLCAEDAPNPHCPYHHKARIHYATAVLSLFPEGPRWQVVARDDSVSRNYWVRTATTTYLTRQDAGERMRQIVHRDPEMFPNSQAALEGPLWPSFPEPLVDPRKHIRHDPARGLVYDPPA